MVITLFDYISYNGDASPSSSDPRPIKILALSNDDSTLAACAGNKILLFDVPTIVGGVCIRRR